MRLQSSRPLKSNKWQSLSPTIKRLLQFSSPLQSMPLYRALHSFAHASQSYYGDLTFHSTPFFFTVPSEHKAGRSYHCAWSEFYLELHMLQPCLKAWCWCLASLGPLAIKRGAILSPRCLLWASKVKKTKVWDHEWVLGSLLEVSIHITELRICTWCNSSFYFPNRKGVTLLC